MPNIRSAKKRVLVAERNRVRNVGFKSSMRTAIKRLSENAAEGNKEAAETSLKLAYSLIDRAVLKGILKKNTGARYKSRITKAATKQLAS